MVSISMISLCRTNGYIGTKQIYWKPKLSKFCMIFAVFDLDCKTNVEIYLFLEDICIFVTWLFGINCGIQKN